MKKLWYLQLLAFGIILVSIGTASATELPAPVVYLTMDGDLTNSGSGGSTYNGWIESVEGSIGGTPVYVDSINSKGIKINPSLIYPGGTSTPVDENVGNNVAIPYTLQDEGTIALWYRFTSPHYSYQQIFNNSGDKDAWECWADAYDGHDDGKGHCFGARAGGDYSEDYMTSYTDGWHHVALAWTRHTDNTAQVDFTIYYDGETSEGATVVDAAWMDPGDTVYLGGNYGNSNGNGTWDEVRIYDECLTIDQIVEVKNYAYIPGDANLDNKVDGSDVTILANNWQEGVSGTADAKWSMGDFNGDGKVDGSDVTILANNWQEGVSAATASVPEPNSLILLLTVAASLLIWKRK